MKALSALAVVVVFCAFASKARAGDASRVWSGFECIHRYEGSWNANTGNGYYGGLQMDYTFMRSYGSDYLRAWGTADHWPPAVQIAVAIRAFLQGRGFWPWPNSARLCGLI